MTQLMDYPMFNSCKIDMNVRAFGRVAREPRHKGTWRWHSEKQTEFPSQESNNYLPHDVPPFHLSSQPLLHSPGGFSRRVLWSISHTVLPRALWSIYTKQTEFPSQETNNYLPHDLPPFQLSKAFDWAAVTFSRWVTGSLSQRPGKYSQELARVLSSTRLEAYHTCVES